MSPAMPTGEIRYPAFCFNQGTVAVVAGEDELTTCTKTGLKNGWYDGLRIIDSAGHGFRARGATFVSGVGPFGGYTIFLNRRIRVRIDVEADPRPPSVEDLKRILRQSFDAWHGWESRGDFEELRERLDRVATREEVLAFLREVVGSS